MLSYKHALRTPHACIKACVFYVGIGINVCVAATICYWLLTPYLVHWSNQAGKNTIPPCHSGNADKLRQFVESHISEEETPWHSLYFNCSRSFCLQVAAAWRTVMILKSTSQYKQLLGNKSYGQGYGILEPCIVPLSKNPYWYSLKFLAIQMGYIVVASPVARHRYGI